MFWIIVGIVAVVVLVPVLYLAWRSDHRGTRKAKFVSSQSDDPGVIEGRAASYRNTISGPTGGI